MSPDTASVLDEILAGVREDVAARQVVDVPLEQIRELAAAAPKAARRVQPAAHFGRTRDRRGEAGLALARPAGRRSPTRLSWRRSTRPGGARCISVLTEGRWFGGSLADLDSVRAAVDASVLRKRLRGVELPGPRGPRARPPTWCC